MSNSAELLRQLEELNKTNSISVFVPSLKKEIKIKNITLRQQKNLLKTSIDETLTKLSFIINIYNILKENILDNINVDELFTFDRTAIAIALRAYCLDSNYKLNDNNYNLLEKIKEYPTISFNFISEKIIEINNLKVALQAPRLNVDYKMSQFSLEHLKQLEDRDFKNVIGELFVQEITKFIKSVSFEGEKPLFIDFNNTAISEQIKIIEKFPSSLTNNILDFIKNYRDIENKITSIGQFNIEVDGAFFSI
jgi:hypothetical protein